MRNKRFPSYPDDNDYTTNSPSYYEDLARKQKLIQLLAEKIWEYEKTLDLTLEDIETRVQQRFSEWDGRIESFPDNVESLLQEWLSDGTLDHIINDTVLNWKADQSELDKTNTQLIETRNELDKTNAQLIETRNELETKKVDRNENESIGMAMLKPDIKTALNNGEWSVNLNTSDIENKAIKQSKIGLDTGYLPKTILYKRGSYDSTSAKRAISTDEVSLPVGTVIKSSNNIQFGVRYSDESTATRGWETEWIVSKNIPLHINVRRSDDSVIDPSELHLLSDFIEVITPETSVKRRESVNNFPFNPVFEYGSVDSSTGDFLVDEGSSIRVGTREFINVKKGSKLVIKDPDRTSYALYIEGSDNYVSGGWRKEAYTFTEDVRIKLMQKFDDNSVSVSGHTVFFTNNIEIVSDNTFIRGRDVKDFSIKDNNITGNWVWGYEYMFSWYDKLRKNQSVTMTWAGDSTTQNSDVDLEFKRHTLGKKLLTLGGYDEELVTSINAGHGAQHTGNWLGGDKDDDKRTPNGFLDEDMQHNPDLYIFGYGFNDGSNSHFPNLTWEKRIDRFEENLNEGLKRIRGTMYNKSPDDMAIILTTPIAAYSDSRGNTPQVWNDKIRPIIQKACRDYHCAFVDITARQYDHGFSSTWSTNDDFVHPNETANVDYMSMFDDIIMPRLLHK